MKRRTKKYIIKIEHIPHADVNERLIEVYNQVLLDMSENSDDLEDVEESDASLPVSSDTF